MNFWPGCAWLDATLRLTSQFNSSRKVGCSSISRPAMVKVNGKAVDLTPTQYAILRLLVTHAGKVLTHAHILREVWGPKNREQSQYLRVYISQLRSKLRAAGAPRDLIKTESGVGYRLQSMS